MVFTDGAAPACEPAGWPVEDDGRVMPAWWQLPGLPDWPVSEDFHIPDMYINIY